MESEKICSVNGCKGVFYAKTYCGKHYQQSRKGTLGAPKIRTHPVKHGTLYGYQGRGCRCAECTDTASQYMRIRRGGSPPKLATPKYGVKPSTNNRSRKDDDDET